MQDDGATIIFELEGKLAGPWVEELQHCWERALDDGRHSKVILKIVSFIDVQGRGLLTKMHRQGVELVAQGCMTRAIVEEIKREEKADGSISRRNKHGG